MDSLITAAARALAAGDPLGALKRVALRDDAPALALRGIAHGAARRSGAREGAACGARPAPSARRSRWPVRAASSPRPRSRWPRATLAGRPRRSTRRGETLEAHGDRVNAAHARNLGVRRLLLIGRLDEAERALAALDPAPLPPASQAAHELAVAGIAMRRLRTQPARAALARAAHAARAGADSGADGGSRERARAAGYARGAPARAAARSGRCCSRRSRRCWRRRRWSWTPAVMSCARPHAVSLARRPVLFALARRWPRRGPATSRATCWWRAPSGAKAADESHRARLRVEIGRLRTVLRTLAACTATAAVRAGAAPRARGRRAGPAGR